MLFNSYIFWAFLLVVVVLYRRLEHRAQNWMLVVASCVFYGWWDWRFLFLIWFKTIVTFYAVATMVRATDAAQRKRWLIGCLVFHLGILAFFKYFGFFTHEMVRLLESLGLHPSLPALKIILPVGISFYTFQAISYTVDVYRKQVAPAAHLRDFALYVFYFPQLVAGPIERSTELLPQVLNPDRLRLVDFRAGLYLVILGLFKKVVIADNLATVANTVFDQYKQHPDQLTGLECWVGVYAFAFQIYGDFSGYSSIAQGVARWMGFQLMDNFRHPYFAVTPSDFWGRWHISLSTWLRDYLYIPLGGNRQGSWLTYRNLMLTMLLGGLWHGANWTFIAWGLFHGVILCLYRVLEARGMAPQTWSAGRRAVMLLVMFHLVCVSWLLFRADDFTQAWAMLKLMLTDWRGSYFAVFGLALALFYAGPLLVYEWWLERKRETLWLLKAHWLLRGLVYSYCVWMLLFFPAPVGREFIYFQF